MAHRVVWSNSALADVNAIAAYIAKDSPAYAQIVVKKLIILSRTLSRFPNSGRQVPEYHNPKIRELIAYSYRMIYEVLEEEA